MLKDWFFHEAQRHNCAFTLYSSMGTLRFMIICHAYLHACRFFWTLFAFHSILQYGEFYHIYVKNFKRSLYLAFVIVSLRIPYLSYTICSVGKVTRILILEIVLLVSLSIVFLMGIVALVVFVLLAICSTQSFYNHHYEQSLYSVCHLNSPSTPNCILKFQIDLTVNSCDNMACFAV